MPSRKRPGERRSPNLLLLLNDDERRALDQDAERAGVTYQHYLRTLILAAHTGELPVPPGLFEP